MNRNKEIIKTSLLGIIANLFLSAFKLAVGTITNSIAITLDAVNNLTDALSSVITIVGTKLSEKKPDRAHPFGHGRGEYVTSLAIGIIILYAGLLAIKESVERILHPEATSYTLPAVIIIGVAILVKILVGLYTRRRGKALDSVALIASGRDALNDSIATAATFLAALVYLKFGLAVEAFVGLAIAALILKTGIDTVRETISSILGERVDMELIHKIRDSILSFPEVDGVFNIVVHSYGKEKLIGSAHIEIPDVLKASWVDNLQRAIKQKVLEDTGVEMLGITIYAENTRDSETKEIRDSIRDITGEYTTVTGVHGFYLDKADKAIKFVLTTDFETTDPDQLSEEIKSRVDGLYPEYSVFVETELDVVD